MEGRVALVTGGARGIGRGIAQAFLQAGARVMIGDLGGAGAGWKYELAAGSELERTAEELSAMGETRCVAVDVTDPASCANAVEATEQAFGGLDVLVNNAGVVASGDTASFSEADWDRVFAVNTKGIFLMTQAALPALQRSSSAAIINTASIAGKRGFPKMAAYCGSKFAAVGITQSLAAELAPQGIRVNALCPGVVGTAMWLEHLLPTNATTADEKDDQFNQAMAHTIPMGRPQTPEDMGQAAVYLATAVNVTGISLSVAGGFEMN
ncbi:MAG: glucose 1-dehydrogenase [Gammaproteobacteria bacterium]|nr:MAG: glucose 1-dehydrogenase [Gammaproteobacteria bacterium]